MTIEEISSAELRGRKLDIVTACRSADLPILRLACEGLRRFAPPGKLYVITAGTNLAKFGKVLPAAVEVLDEDTVIPDMKLADLPQLSLPGFPQGAGWYFQQLLKLGFAFREPRDDYYLIWDADTVLLRSLRFFDDRDRMLLTVADENHRPYFDTYRHLLKEEPNRDCSFIAQHMVAHKPAVREMLNQIDRNFPGNESWAWKIMRNLRGTSTNLFSEYEMLGNFVKNHYPESVATRELHWLRDGSRRVRGVPAADDLARLAKQYDFVAFESGQRGLRRLVRRIRSWRGRIGRGD